MYRGGRIVVTAVVAGILLLVGLMTLGFGFSLRVGKEIAGCVVLDTDRSTGWPSCRDDQLTGQADATVVGVSAVHYSVFNAQRGIPTDAVSDVEVRFDAGGKPVDGHAYVREGGSLPAQDDVVTVRYAPSNPERFVALDDELVRVHAQFKDLPLPDSGIFILVGALVTLLCVGVAVGGGLWASKATPRPRPPQHLIGSAARPGGQPPPGYGYPPQGPPPGYGYPPQGPPPGYGHPPQGPPGFPPPGYAPQPQPPNQPQPPQQQPPTPPG